MPNINRLEDYISSRIKEIQKKDTRDMFFTAEDVIKELKLVLEKIPKP